jgi:hypothetical protein
VTWSRAPAVPRRTCTPIAASAAKARQFLSEPTVKTHVTRALSKLGLRDRIQAVVFASESGLIQPGG